MKVDFRRLTWENYPSTETPINADNLNRLEEGVAGLYSDVAEIEQELGGGVGEYVTDWLNEHVDPVGSAVVVDNTLSIEGAAADAKKTGDEILASKVVVDDTLSTEGAAADAKKTGDELTALKEDILDKADIDGYYQDMTVGDAEQLVASQYVEDSVPYGFRTTGGSADVGNREYVDAVVGGTVVWNQLFPFDSNDTWGVNGCTVTVTNGRFVLTGTGAYTSTSSLFPSRIYNALKLIKDHKYYIGFDGDYSFDNIHYIYYASAGSNGIQMNKTSRILNVDYDGVIDSEFVASFTAGAETSADFVTFMVDLTQMFGTSIANYAYNLDIATAGAGVSWLKKHFPKIFDSGYIPYNAGELLSVSGLASHDTVGFNQWDEEYEVGQFNPQTGEPQSASGAIRSKNLIPVLPSTEYCVDIPVTGRIFFCDYEEKMLSTVSPSQPVAVVTTPSDCYYMKFHTANAYGDVYNHDICINLSWSGWRNGEYEPYEKHSYPLDSSLTLRGIPKLDAQNNLYHDGDEYLPDGTVNRRYGVVDLGTLTWIKGNRNNADTGNTFYTSTQIDAKTGLDSGILCPVLVTNPAYNAAWEAIGVNEIRYSSGVTRSLVACSTATDAASFKSAMSGVMLVYELATPTIETAEPYQQVQICDDFGTEEYVTDGIVPVGHNTRYPANLRDKLQHLPDLADDDGYYMIGQSNKQMHLELFRIPKAPTTDGTYTLKATVSGGTPTYTWEAQT